MPVEEPFTDHKHIATHRLCLLRIQQQVRSEWLQQPQQTTGLQHRLRSDHLLALGLVLQRGPGLRH
jgi:hypothetical protein